MEDEARDVGRLRELDHEPVRRVSRGRRAPAPARGRIDEVLRRAELGVVLVVESDERARPEEVL